MTVTIDYYGVEGTGKNLTEAKKNAGEVIRATLKRVATPPRIIRLKNWMVLIWADAHGWCHKVQEIDAIESGHLYGCSHSSGSEDDVVVAAKRHLADCVTMTDAEAVAFFSSHPSPDKNSLSEWRRKQGFYRAYHYAKENQGLLATQGVTDLHRWACEHQNDFEVMVVGL